MASGLQQAGYGSFPDLLAAMRAGANRGPFVMQADLDNSDTATAQTVDQMCSLIKESISDSVVQSIARRAWETWGQGSNDPRSVAWSAWWYAKHSIQFVLDGPAARNFVGLPEALEFMVSPAVMLRTRKMQGDCDDFTMMICALLGASGLGYEIITVAASPREPQTFSHVYCRAILPDGSRVPLDASHGKYPGWQVPAAHVSRLQAWDADGNPVSDLGANNWNGLHGYVARFGLGACGDCNDWDEAGNCIGYDYAAADCTDNSSGYTVIGPPALAPAGTAGNTCVASSPSDCPAGTTFIQGTALPSTLSGGSCGAGLTLYNGSCVNPSSLNAGQQVAAALQSIFAPNSPLAKAILPNQQAGTVTLNSNSLLLYGGLAAVALIVLMAVSKK